MKSSCSFSQNGNVLFIILIAIALFGALSFAVNSMMRGESSERISEQKAALMAGEIIDYARQIKQAVQNIRISNACDVAEISFTVTGADGYEHSPVAADKCKIFNLDGGGMSFITGPGNEVWFFKAQIEIYKIGTSCAASSCVELLAGILVNDLAICKAINRRLGLPESIAGTSFPTTFSATVPKFTGSFATYNSTLGNAIAPEIAGKPAACIDTSGAPGASVFYQTLIAR